MRVRFAPIALCLPLFLAACHDRASAPHGTGAVGPSAPAPFSQRQLPTTDGEIALGNLQAQIDAEMRLASHGPLTVSQRAGVADLVAMRGQFLGSIADYEQANTLAEDLVRDAPTDGRAFLARAQARSTFHRFDDALADLDRAEAFGASSAAVASARAAVFQATGRYGEALALRTAARQLRATVATLGAEATLRGELGELDEADRLFTEAQRRYRDVSPFPVAWLQFQQGKVWMREGDLARARTFFKAAHDRLPAFAAAEGHLAEVESALGDTERAITRLESLARRSDDPDYAAQLARILDDASRPDEARVWRAYAVARYEDLMARHPEAFADHAAEFRLASGEPLEAVVLARRNAALRPTGRAYELLLSAALAARDDPGACDTATRASAVPYAWPNLRRLTLVGLAACARVATVP